MGALPPPPRGGFSEGFALVGYTAAALISGLALYAYLVLIEAHLVSDRLSPQPAQFAPLRLDPAITRDIRRRSKAFDRARRSGAEVTLRLSNDDINEWFAVTTEPQIYEERLRVQVVDRALAMRLSVPMDGYGFPGRYLNARLDLDLGYDGDGLRLVVEDAHVGGERLPPRLLDALRWLTAASRYVDIPGRRRTLRGVGSVRIRDDQLIIDSR